MIIFNCVVLFMKKSKVQVTGRANWSLPMPLRANTEANIYESKEGNNNRSFFSIRGTFNLFFYFISCPSFAFPTNLFCNLSQIYLLQL